MTEIETIVRKAADYVAETQPRLEKQAAAQSAFVKSAQRAVGVLAHRNIIDADKRDQLVEKLAQDHSYALVMLEKLAGIVGADQMGAPSDITKPNDADVDPWEREYFPERVNVDRKL
jgi:hypothetical protein